MQGCDGRLDLKGRCSVCGGLYDISDALMDAIADEVADDLAARSSDLDSNRRLCDDGSCLGVLGADGKCNVCGRVSRSG